MFLAALGSLFMLFGDGYRTEEQVFFMAFFGSGCIVYVIHHFSLWISKKRESRRENDV
jgi:hypothetical protein